MEYAYAALILNESGREINEANLTGVLDAAGVAVDESRVKALVAALEDVDLNTIDASENESGGRTPLDSAAASANGDSPGHITALAGDDAAPGEGGETQPDADNEQSDPESIGGP